MDIIILRRGNSAGQWVQSKESEQSMPADSAHPDSTRPPPTNIYHHHIHDQHTSYSPFKILIYFHMGLATCGQRKSMIYILLIVVGLIDISLSCLFSTQLSSCFQSSNNLHQTSAISVINTATHDANEWQAPWISNFAKLVFKIYFQLSSAQGKKAPTQPPTTYTSLLCAPHLSIRASNKARANLLYTITCWLHSKLLFQHTSCTQSTDDRHTTPASPPPPPASPRPPPPVPASHLPPESWRGNTAQCMTDLLPYPLHLSPSHHTPFPSRPKKITLQLVAVKLVNLWRWKGKRRSPSNLWQWNLWTSGGEEYAAWTCAAASQISKSAG